MKTKTTHTARPAKPQRINLDLPPAFLQEIDGEADRIGVARQAFIKMVLAAHLRGDRTGTK